MVEYLSKFIRTYSMFANIFRNIFFFENILLYSFKKQSFMKICKKRFHKNIWKCPLRYHYMSTLIVLRYPYRTGSLNFISIFFNNAVRYWFTTMVSFYCHRTIQRFIWYEVRLTKYRYSYMNISNIIYDN